MLVRLKVNVKSLNLSTLILYATSNKSWIFQIFPKTLCKIFINSIAITSRVSLSSILKSRNSIMSDLNFIRSFLI